jgi:hypothetical protein
MPDQPPCNYPNCLDPVNGKCERRVCCGPDDQWCTCGPIPNDGRSDDPECPIHGTPTERTADRRIAAAVEWGRSVADEIDVTPLFRALGVVR